MDLNCFALQDWNGKSGEKGTANLKSGLIQIVRYIQKAGGQIGHRLSIYRLLFLLDSEKVNIYHISPFWRMEPVISPVYFFFLKFTPIALSNADMDTIEAFS